MKTKNKIFITLITALVVATSCDFLDENPVSTLSSEQVFNSESGIESALIGCYSTYSSFNLYGTWAYEMHCSSIILESYVGSATIPAYTLIGSVKPDDPSLLGQIYAAYYVTINGLNDLIQNTETSPVSFDIKKRYIAEAKFLRASCYFDLVRIFGRVPLRIKSTTTISDAIIGRSSLTNIYKQILNDLTIAENEMPDFTLQTEGRPHKIAATAMKAKVYLFMACLTQEHLTACNEKETIDQFRNEFIDQNNSTDATTQLWQKCFDNAKTVKVAGIYELVTGYSTLWNGKSRNTKESILELQYSTIWGSNVGNFGSRTANAINSQLNGIKINNNAGRINAGRSTFIENWKKYGNGKYLLKKTGDATPVMNSDREVGADPRINVNYVYYLNPAYVNNQPKLLANFPNSTYSFTASMNKFPHIRKYQTLEMTNQRSNMNLILFRYADLLLILAEAANELDNKTTAKECIEEILIRARNENTTVVTDGNDSHIFGKKQPVSWDYANMSKTQMRQAIMQEREFELLGECQEFFDVRRRGIDYLKYRMDMHNKWFKRQFVANETNLGDGAYEGWGKTFAGYSYETEYTAAYETTEYLTRALYLPIPDKEIRLNTAIINDQNFGW